MRTAAITLALGLAAVLPSHARMGDSAAQAASRYGQPVAASAHAGAQTSTQTFAVSGLQVTCGYVAGKVEMETYTRPDQALNRSEVEALLRTNGTKRLAWTTPQDGYVDGTYTRSDGVTATLSGNKLAIQSPKWTAALAQDQAAAKAAAATASAASAANGINPNYSTGAGTNAAGYVESPATTNGAPANGSSATQTTTNAP
jgi:hypothetical protein